MFSPSTALRHLIVERQGLFDLIADFIIRPPRVEFTPAVDLGPVVFRIGDEDPERFQRTDITLQNMRGMKVECSWFRLLEGRKQPCVVYLHGNCGSRYDSLEALFLLRHGFSLFTFDATGCGLSDGEYISLGFYERQDLAAVVEHLSAQKDVDGIALWGRSMGAVTSIMYAAKDPSIKCIVCDSPFSTLRWLIEDLVKRHTMKKFPSIIINSIVNRIRKRIAKRAAFDIDDLDAVKYASECVVPAFIFHGEADDFVLPWHSEKVSNSFNGSCLYHVVGGGHNDEREEEVKDTIVHFLTLFLVLKPEGERLFQQNRPRAALGMSRKNSKTAAEQNTDDATSNTALHLVSLKPINFTKLRLQSAFDSLTLERSSENGGKDEEEITT